MNHNQLPKAEKPKFHWHYFFSPWLVLTLVLALGLAIYILKPRWVLHKQIPVELNTESLFDATMSLYTTHKDFNIVGAVNRGDNCVIKYLNSKTGRYSEIEYHNLRSVRDKMDGIENNPYLLLKQNLTEIVLAKAFNDTGEPRLQFQVIHAPAYKKNLFTAETEIGNNQVCGYIVPARQMTRFKLIKGDSLQLSVSPELLEQIQKVNLFNYQDSEICSEIADSLSGWLCAQVTNKDIFCLIANTHRAAWFRNNRDIGKIKSMMNARIVAAHDLNLDSVPELFIITAGSRYTPGSLICYDTACDEVLWEFAYYQGFQELEIADFDNDGSLEVALGTRCHANHHGANWFELNNDIYSVYSSIIILDDQGNIKDFQGQKGIYNTGGFCWTTFLEIMPDKRILIAADSDKDPNLKHLMILNPATGQRDTLDISFHNVLALDSVDDFFVMIHKKANRFTKTLISPDLKIISENTFISRQKINISSGTHSFVYKNQRYWIFNPLHIFDDHFNLVYENDLFGNDYLMGLQDNQLFLNSYRYHDRDSYINCLHITPNRKLNINLIFLWSILLVALSAHIITRAVLTIPDNIMEGSYAVLYRFLGFIYNWRIFGKTSVYAQPVVLSLSRRRFQQIITDISDDFQQVHIKNLGLIKLYVYKLQIGNEMHIIQRIAHDIKNQMHLLNLQLTENLTNTHDMEKYQQTIKEHIDKLSHEINMLSDFSRINLLKMENTDLIYLIDTILIKFSNHPRAKDILWNPPTSPVNIKADENLLTIALVNLLDNSLKYSPNDSEVIINLIKYPHKVSLSITNHLMKNPYNLDKGSGIGLQAAEKILSAHGAGFKQILHDSAMISIEFMT